MHTTRRRITDQKITMGIVSAMAILYWIAPSTTHPLFMALYPLTFMLAIMVARHFVGFQLPQKIQVNGLAYTIRLNRRKYKRGLMGLAVLLLPLSTVLCIVGAFAGFWLVVAVWLLVTGIVLIFG